MASAIRDLRKELSTLKRRKREDDERLRLQKQIKDLRPVGVGTARRRRVGKHIGKAARKFAKNAGVFLSGVEL